MNILSLFRLKRVLCALFACTLLPVAAFAGADLVITAHSHDPASPAVGDDLNYFFTVHNNGPDAAGAITLHIAAFSGQVYQGSASPYPFTDDGGGFYTATIGSLAAGGDAPFRITFHITQVASVFANLEADTSGDPNPNNNSAEEDVQVAGGQSADLEVTSVAATPAHGQVGDLRKYHGVVTNNGPDTATGVAIGIQADSVASNGTGFDAFETFASASPAPSPAGADGNGNRFLPLGDIAPHGSVTFDAFYNATQQGSFSRNFFVSISGAQADPNGNNDNLSVPVTNDAQSSNSADVSLTITAPSSIAVGSDITYQFHVANSGPNTATGVQVLVAPSTKEQIVSSSVPFTITAQGGVVDVPDLAAGSNGFDFNFVFTANDPGDITLDGTASSQVADPNSSNNHVAVTTNAVLPPPPPHGGLSATSFTVDESRDPQGGLTDTVLRFAAAQLGTPAGLIVRVQANTVAGNPESGWTDLNNGNAGQMTYDPTSQQFLLSSLSYPAVNHVSFRAISSASGYHDSISNVVGDFNLTSSKPRLDSPALALTGNGPFADLYFRTFSGNIVSGTTERIQQTTTPFDENSWGNLNDGHGGAMTPSNDPKRFFLMANQVQTGHGIFFRVIASKSGSADGISQPNGPYDITPDAPPTITSLTISPKKSGSGKSLSDPIVLNAGPMTISATVKPSSGRTMKTLKLLFDGDTRFAVDHQTTLQYVTSSLPIGDHVLEAVGVDDLSAQARLGTNPVFIRIIPHSSSAEKAETTSGGTKVAAIISGNVFTVAKSGGVWTDPSTWKDLSGKNGVPGPNDVAIVGSASVRFGLDGDAGAVSIDGGHLIGQASLNVHQQITIAAATIDGPMTIRIMEGAVCELVNPSNIQFNPDGHGFKGNILNDGTCNVHGGAGVVGADKIANLGILNFQTPLSVPASAGKDPSSDTRLLGANSPTNDGQLLSALGLIGQDGNGLIGQDGNGLIGQDGNGLISQDGNSIVGQGGGNIVGQGGGNIVGQGGGNLVNTNGSNLVNTNGSNIVGQGGGNIVGQGGGNFHGEQTNEKTEHSEVEAETTASGFIQNGGETNLNGIIITGDVTLNGGVLSGSGIIQGNLTNNGGYIAPGHSPGAIGVTGNFTQGPNGTLVMEDGGAFPGQFDQLQVGGTANLGGHLDLKLINGYTPNAADTFAPLNYGAHSGAFASISANGTVTLNDTGLLSTVNPAIASPISAEAANISTRAEVQSGDDVAIGGFIVTGPPGSTKKVIVRGIGPSLGAAGITGALADPFLELHKGKATLATNDNWKKNMAAVKATKLAPKNDLESAIVATLAPGGYTAILRGAHGEAGVGLVEVYDLSPESAATLGNISTRCKVGTGEDVMIGGFILQGSEPANILVRAIGPSLSKAGVHGVLADPELELFNADGAAITNNDWRETQESEIVATGIPPTNDHESAIRATLAPGAYTAIVRGNNNSTGVGLVEVYRLP